ncbi:MAG: MiaB/RimO family radical SAM methylthiotransferase [Candidatus Omnitrophota bacterium]
MSKKIAVLSLGCARNLVDSEIILGRLRGKGYQIVDLGLVSNTISNGVDVVLVNTCAFIKEAKEESIQAILNLIDLKNKGKIRKIIVAGCLSQRYKHTLCKQLPEIDAFLGVISLNHTQERFRLTPAHYAYVKICEGCINNCSFCAIPKIKPGFTSRTPASIISEVKGLDNQGCSEINLIGQDITAYGWDLYQELGLVNLVKQILKAAKGINWLRMLYLSPQRLSDELIELVAGNGRIVKYIDLPLQHINNRLLKLMRRDITSYKIRKLIDKIRGKIPNVAIRTSLIVGFPTETDKEFLQLLDFVKEARFERLGLFMYSREEDTKAFHFPGQVHQKIKEERYNIVMSAQQEIACQVNKKWMGKALKVLIEKKDEDGVYIGRSQYDAPEVDGEVFVKTKKELSVGNFQDVEIIDTLEYDLVGEVS